MNAKKKIDVKATVREIGFAEAKNLVEGQPVNRPLSKAAVRFLGEQIAHGLWSLNGEAIILDDKDQLLDGQHRLAGLVYAIEQLDADPSTVIETIVVAGIPRERFPTIDQGRKRSTSDVLSVDDHPHSKELAVALRLLKIRTSGGKVKSTGKIPPYELLNFLHEHRFLVDSVEFISDIGPLKEDDEFVPMKQLLSPGYAAAIHYLAKAAYDSASHDTIDKFFVDLCDLNHNDKGSPAFALRKLLQANRQNTDAKLQRDTLVALVIKALLTRLENETVLKLKLRKGEEPTFGELDRVGMEDDE